MQEPYTPLVYVFKLYASRLSGALQEFSKGVTSKKPETKINIGNIDIINLYIFYSDYRNDNEKYTYDYLN